ncbi:MAG: hypothetical protein GF364_18635 [Candidatus Lokiarchaeota archaeon]|nr:hypothetical protein [Candidatus Lokiarchaeota archaeon]
MERQFQNRTTGRSTNNSINPERKKKFNINPNFGISKVDILTKNLLRARGAARIQVPNYTTTERNEIYAAQGDIIFNTTTKKHQGYDGSSWNNLY